MWPDNDSASQENCLAPHKLCCALTVNNQLPELSPSKLWVIAEYKSRQKKEKKKAGKKFSWLQCRPGRASTGDTLSADVSVYNNLQPKIEDCIVAFWLLFP